VTAKNINQDLEKQFQAFFEKIKQENSALQKLVDALTRDLKKKLEKPSKQLDDISGSTESDDTNN